MSGMAQLKSKKKVGPCFLPLTIPSMKDEESIICGLHLELVLHYGWRGFFSRECYFLLVIAKKNQYE